MKTSVPESMLAVRAGENGKPQVVSGVSVPRPGPGEVLVRMAAAPINPSDIGFLKGAYGNHVSAPVVPGFEGSGTVIAAGKGLLPRLLLGRRVACFGSPAGTWAEYLATRAALCVPLKKEISLEQGATMLVNPLTALAFFTMAKRGGHRAIVNTAAASALGRMVFRLGRRHQVPVINIVRRDLQADVLTGLGAEHVLVSTDRNFAGTLSSMMHRLKATLILDAVGGELFQLLLGAAPLNSTFVLYANLSGGHVTVEPRTLWKENKKIEGFFLGSWAAARGLSGMLRDIGAIRAWGGTDLQSPVQNRLPLAEVQQAMDLYLNNMTAGKVLLVANAGSRRPD